MTRVAYLSPSDHYGPLFDAVQMRRILTDGKDFADAVPRGDPAAIRAAFAQAGPLDDAALAAFVAAQFELPPVPPAAPPPEPALPLRDRIRALWPVLTRAAVTPRPFDSALPLPGRFVVPGGRFRELYYWDSYFTMLGLAADGEDALVESMIDLFTGLIERFGFVPNGPRTYYLGRSQPPAYALMVGLSRATDAATRARRLEAMIAEHRFWMTGARAVALADGAVLNRYWDDRTGPRDESWREDVLTARAASRPAAAVQRDLRAGAESGWDYSSRWLGAGEDLPSIRTTAIVPVDLNCLLAMLEDGIATHAAALGDARAAAFADAHADRARAIRRWLWDEEAARYGDLDLAEARLTPVISAALCFPLYAGLADARQAAATAALIAERLLAPGGLLTTTRTTGQQWDAPNGWAPLQWIAIQGLRRCGHPALAAEIRARWLATVERCYRDTGLLFEKYDVAAARAGGGGEYRVQAGFGWTNGVTAALLDEEVSPSADRTASPAR